MSARAESPGRNKAGARLVSADAMGAGTAPRVRSEALCERPDPLRAQRVLVESGPQGARTRRTDAIVPQVDQQQWRVATERGGKACGALIANAFAEEAQLFAPVDDVAPVSALHVGQLAPPCRRQADQQHGMDGAHAGRLKIPPTIQ
eukprot:scaffold1768_cov116-Isochrysis_galbana.AAC.11